MVVLALGLHLFLWHSLGVPIPKKEQVLVPFLSLHQHHKGIKLKGGVQARSESAIATWQGKAEVWECGGNGENFPLWKMLLKYK